MKADRAPILGLVAGLVLLAAASVPWPVRLIWNRTPSVPTGLYVVRAHIPHVRGDLVAFLPSPEEAAWIEARGYTGEGWPLIKRIAALEGDDVCRFRETVIVAGVVAARALAADDNGAQLPVWQGCRHLKAGEVFLLADHPRSIDGRYFGVQPAQRILGKVTRAWPIPLDDGARATRYNLCSDKSQVCSGPGTNSSHRGCPGCGGSNCD
ncbi:MAG: S26 family signal peptidase [Hyphomonas sp.]|uniref:S26 family signal peptidase n=1 Tax=Hyphomonas sp. TaxID=87 RepID=UPI0017A2C456|nr:S26 family signal peptidase [Hyphomonas sp.]MBU3919512.1 S26 family signal peptidase [Alphaproteobacteria bacterium]MBA3069117.1 S26 family signal peptidase [Hyphomonas sp.]MBU4061532.1 S26 family signal peptidase [Alphaproteobacteria bacterium]MBU4165390.1 S26 family signal peptidase [Alphaproteobacteria bacterium]MBU4569583.1 S26 family signal peptidase [Alphaproteobacteria bacterium]